VAPDKSAPATVLPTLASKNCTELSYRITTPPGKFNVERFAKEFVKESDASESGGWDSALLVSRNPEQDGYHVHIFWEPDDDDPTRTKLQVDYHVWPPEDDDTEKHGVFAEDFFDWVGPYFDGTSVNAHIHAEFEYPVEKWQTRIMLLPIRVPFDEKTAVIDGFSVTLPSEPEGVSQVWVVRTKRNLKLQVFADRAVHFKGFSPHGDIDALSAVVKKLIGEKES
jgi:hypothetical protein